MCHVTGLSPISKDTYKTHCDYEEIGFVAKRPLKTQNAAKAHKAGFEGGQYLWYIDEVAEANETLNRGT
eukprot:NODE_7173_length_457_cov_1.383085.p1 GENE.NODE_7173_length_457_cov_1.383085~~NODE_7173_length_457_cov_1.383085.p1  ORF type:complete len:69 (-),score=14.08 NODE_7173_length_457_cov_1.383085:144-350(-)